MTTGMVLGKFMPPHRGHLYLIDFARHYVDQLTVVVGTLPSEPIDGHLRFQWMRELCPDSEVRHLHKELPQEPSESPIFWDLWRENLLDSLDAPPDFVFASEGYGHRLAEELGARFIPVDPQRTIVPISGTAIRENPLKYWDYLPAPVRPHYLKRVCIFGPESCGKSTLSQQLADHYKTVAVAEYARTLLENHQGDLQEADMMTIALGQRASEKALAPHANRLLICDTDVLLTSIWYEFLYDHCPEPIQHIASQQTYDLYLLTDIDLPWEEDPVRYLPEARQEFFDRCQQGLEKSSRTYVIIRGKGQQRLRNAINAIDSHISSNVE